MCYFSFGLGQERDGEEEVTLMQKAWKTFSNIIAVVGGLSRRACWLDNTFKNHQHQARRTLELPEPVTMPAAAI